MRLDSSRRWIGWWRERSGGRGSDGGISEVGRSCPLHYEIYLYV
jgi:hypothetical protein